MYIWIGSVDLDCKLTLAKQTSHLFDHQPEALYSWLWKKKHGHHSHSIEWSLHFLMTLSKVYSFVQVWSFMHTTSDLLTPKYLLSRQQKTYLFNLYIILLPFIDHYTAQSEELVVKQDTTRYDTILGSTGLQ